MPAAFAGPAVFLLLRGLAALDTWPEEVVNRQTFFTLFTASKRKCLSPTSLAVLTETGIFNLFSTFLLWYLKLYIHFLHICALLPVQREYKTASPRKSQYAYIFFCWFVFDIGFLYVALTVVELTG